MNLAYRILGLGCLVSLVTNIYKHGWSVGGFCLPLILSILLFSLGGGTRERPWWKFRYYTTLSMFTVLLCFVIYSAVLR